MHLGKQLNNRRETRKIQQNHRTENSPFPEPGKAMVTRSFTITADDPQAQLAARVCGSAWCLGSYLIKRAEGTKHPNP